MKLPKCARRILSYLLQKHKNKEKPVASKIELAEELNYSPSTIKDALSLLGQLGLVKRNRRTGYYVLVDIPRAKKLLEKLEGEEE